jgi:hypothetical protein
MLRTFLPLAAAAALSLSAHADVPAYLILGQGAPSTTAENFLTADRAVNWAMDRVFAARSDTLRTAGGVVHRAVRLVFLDLPIDYMPMLIQHEAFGHGTRMREAGYGSFAIRVEPLWPYGDGHGYTLGSQPPADLTLDEDMAIDGAGMDANDVFARSLRLRWVADGRLDRHQAHQYFLNAGNRPAYVWRTHGISDGRPGDVHQLIAVLNLRNGGHTLHGRPLDAEDLGYRTLPALLDPFAWIALWTALDLHVAHGRPGGPLPMPSLAGTRMLPLVRTGFAPYGPEYYLECLLARGARILDVTWRQSDPGAEDAYGLGLSARNLATWGEWALDARAETWRQPELRLAGSWRDQLQDGPVPEAFGAGLWLTFRWREARGLFLEAGGKSRGYVQGEMLGAGLALRSGLSFAWPL